MLEDVRSSVESVYIEEELKEPKKEFQILFNLMPDPAVIVDGKGKFLAVNDRVEVKTGFKREELLGKNFLKTKIVTAKSKALLTKNLAKVMMEIEIAPYEIEALTKDGKRIPAEGTAAKIVYMGKPAVMAVFRDITERKNAERELRKSEERFRAFFETAEDSIFIKDRSLKYIQVNPAMEGLFGLPASKLIGLTDDDLFGKEVGAHIREVDARVLGGEVVEEEATKPVKGVQATFHVIKVPMRGNSGEIVGLCGIARDITKRKRMEEELQKISNEQAVLLSTAPAMIFWTDKEGNFIRVNEAFAKALQKSPNDIEGKSLFDLYPEDMARNFHGDNLEVIKSGIPKRHIEEPVETPAGIMWVSTDKIPYRDEKGEITGIIGFSVDITERKTAEEALRESEEKYRNLFENARDLIFTDDLKGNITDVNRVVEEYGFKKEEIIGKSQLKFVPKKYWPRLIMETARGKPVEGEIEIITPKGRVMAEYRSNPIRRGKKVVGSQTIVRDIRERKKMEEKLREYAEQLEEKVENRTTELRRSEEKLRSIFASSPDAITVIDLNGNITECNQATLDLLGYSSKEDLIGKSGFALVAKKDRERAKENLKKILERGSMKNMEYSFLARDGREFPAELSASVIKGSSENPTGIVGITKDITERKERGEALRRSEEKYRDLVELAPDSIITLNTKGLFTSCNRAMTDFTGYSKDEIIGKHFSKIGFLRARDIPKYLKRFYSVLRGKVFEPFEIQWHRKDGTPYFAEVRFSLIREGGKTVGIQAIARDVTERKHLEEKLREQNIRLKRLDEMKSRFISTATHELRTPVVSMKGYTELIRSGRVGEVPKRIDEMLEVVERNTNRLSKLTDDLLDQQRIESGRLKISPETLRLQDVTEEVIQEVKPTIFEKGQTLHVKVPTDLPPVKADRVRISQVIINLLSNASKFTPEGGSIGLKVREASDMVEVQVSDTGFGIAKEDLAKLFKPFPDIQKPSFYQGTGLGLSICRGIIGLHGGKIWAESEGRGKGATFTFTIPKHMETG